MCGIAGIYAYRDAAPPVDRGELLKIREAMAKRGPDGAGLWVAGDRRIGLAHRRLAIIDLSEAGAQPMATADGTLRITFNGEIYNYRELRRTLEAKGFRFRSNSDTEVLLHLYADRGADMVHDLRGMFAFAVWDERRKGLFLARDPFGIKPLYYADEQGTLRFASVVTALVEGGSIGTEEDLAGIGGFYLFGSVPDPFTFYRRIKALPAGATLWADRDGVQPPKTYFGVTEELAKAESAPLDLAPEEAEERIRAALAESVGYHMVADVPVGLFLSAGVDSTCLATLAAPQAGGKLHTLTLGFQEYRNTGDDEAPIAEQTATRLGVVHATRWIERDDFRGEWKNFLAAMDQASIDGVNSYLVARTAALDGLKVAISGLGGDELFAGYPSFRDVPRLKRLVPDFPAAGRLARAVADPLLRRVTSPKYAGLLEYGSSHAGAYLLRRALYMPWELPRLLGAERARLALEALRPLERLQETVRGLKNERCIVTALELSWYMRHQLMRDADWAGMAHGVEIRVPFVDAGLFRALAPMLASRRPPTKAQLIRAIAIPTAAEIAGRPKTGFLVPVREWLRQDLPALPRERGLRGWAGAVARAKGGRRFLSFVTDAFGGHGGIALYNRDLLAALCAYPRCSQVVAIPRLMPNLPEPMPERLAYLKDAVGGKLRYLATVFRLLRGDRSFDLILCGHINLLPVAYFTSRMLRIPLVLFIYGIDAWQPTPSVLANALARRVRWVIGISETTAEKFRSWAGGDGQDIMILPNAIHKEWYAPGPKNPALLARYRLNGRTVLMTLGRLVSTERYKGFDEMLESLPELLKTLPGVAYLIAGSGSDRERLEAKAAALGLADHVIFTGNVPEAEKADHYRLSDAYVMASRGEGFGFVLLEAMACGIPVVASKLDGGREAILDGELGILVDPRDPEDLRRGVLDALRRPKGEIPAGLDHFAYPNFERRTQNLVRKVLSASPRYLPSL